MTCLHNLIKYFLYFWSQFKISSTSCCFGFRVLSLFSAIEYFWAYDESFLPLLQKKIGFMHAGVSIFIFSCAVCSNAFVALFVEENIFRLN